MTGTPGRYEAAFGAQKDRWVLSDSYPWVDLSERTQDNEAVITRGRMSQQQSVSPATLSMLLDNGDGALTPRHPGSPFHPHVVRGTPIRYSVAAGDPFLMCTGAGSAASTGDNAALDITGDIAVAACLEAPIRYRGEVPPASAGFDEFSGLALILKWVPTSDERSYSLWIHSNGSIVFWWSEDGGTTNSASITTRIPHYVSGLYSIAAELDVDNGLGGWTARTYAWRGDIDALIANLSDALVDEAVTTAGTTSIFASTSGMQIGGNLDAGIGRYAGPIREARVLSGDLTTGTEVANPDFSAQALGATSFSDAAGRTWTIPSTAEITNYRPRFYGELAGAYPGWPGASSPGTAQIRWDAAGVLRRMRQNDKTLESPMRRTVGARVNTGLVYAYWPLDEGSEATVAEPVQTEGVSAMEQIGLRFGSDDTCPGSAPVMSVSGGSGFYWSASLAAPNPLPTSWRVELFAKITPDVGPNHLMLWQTTGTIRRVDLLVGTAGFQLDYRNSDGAVITSTNVPWDSRFYGQWLYWTIKLEQNGANVDVDFNMVPLEGAEIQGFIFGTTTSVPNQTIGRVSGILNFAVAPADGISWGNFTVVDGAFPIGWLANADTGWTSESATNRIRRLCREEGVLLYLDGPSGSLQAGVEDGVAQLGPQGLLPFLGLLEESAFADLGYLAEDVATNGLVYRTGSSLVNQTPAITVGPEVTRDLSPADDDQGLVNDLTVEQKAGARRRFVDDASVTAQGPYAGKVTVNLFDSADLLGQGAIRLALATWPEMRYGTVPIELSKTPGLWEAWTAARPGDVIVAEDLPAEHPSPTLRQLLDGYTETISPHRWRVTANVTPEGPWNAGVLDTDGAPDTDAYALDTDGSELDVSVDADDTALVVAVTAGPLWTTDAAQYPLDLDVGGERVTATACTGASSPQTFTVTRGIDGVAVAHDAGTSVRVWQPLILTI